MRLKIQFKYNLGVLYELDDEYKDYVHKYKEDVEVDVKICFVDTANNPTKTNIIFLDSFIWDSNKVSDYIKGKMNNV